MVPSFCPLFIKDFSHDLPKSIPASSQDHLYSTQRHPNRQEKAPWKIKDFQGALEIFLAPEASALSTELQALTHNESSPLFSLEKGLFEGCDASMDLLAMSTRVLGTLFTRGGRFC